MSPLELQMQELRIELAKTSFQQSNLIISSIDKLEVKLKIIEEKLDSLLGEYTKENNYGSTEQ